MASELTRRSLFGGLFAAVAAPAIVRASSIMRVKVPGLMPWHNVSLGFPTRSAPIGSTWLQVGSEKRILWKMGGDGFWDVVRMGQQTLAGKIILPPSFPRLAEAARIVPRPLPAEEFAGLSVEQIGLATVPNGPPPKPTRLPAAFSGLSRADLASELVDDHHYSIDGDPKTDLARLVRREMNMPIVNVRPCPDFAKEDEEATRRHWERKAEAKRRRRAGFSS